MTDPGGGSSPPPLRLDVWKWPALGTSLLFGGAAVWILTRSAEPADEAVAAWIASIFAAWFAGVWCALVVIDARR